MGDRIKCYLLVPVLDDPGTIDSDYIRTECREWNPELRRTLCYRHPETGEEKEFPHQFGPGAMWFANWYRKNWCWHNETEPHLIVATPGGDWDIDSRCSNCGSPNDRLHRCWVRHGTPPDITVDKNGATCKAGAGSFAPKSGRWHGFLRDGYLVT